MGVSYTDVLPMNVPFCRLLALPHSTTVLLYRTCDIIFCTDALVLVIGLAVVHGVVLSGASSGRGAGREWFRRARLGWRSGGYGGLVAAGAVVGAAYPAAGRIARRAGSLVGVSAGLWPLPAHGLVARPLPRSSSAVRAILDGGCQRAGVAAVRMVIAPRAGIMLPLAK